MNTYSCALVDAVLEWDALLVSTVHGEEVAAVLPGLAAAVAVQQAVHLALREGAMKLCGFCGTYIGDCPLDNCYQCWLQIVWAASKRKLT